MSAAPLASVDTQTAEEMRAERTGGYLFSPLLRHQIEPCPADRPANHPGQHVLWVLNNTYACCSGCACNKSHTTKAADSSMCHTRCPFFST
ncbi:hypothetical protein ATANTOWER_014570 [Ataeniobius toweri]|uniref:Uncharacterized protein n=1 Tax=Ataeniobius toweri TaxID=208326 RepID=A0ABU7C2F0_9TELE|nr:hypothetical protein [Ataeniobius toweri]